MRDWSSLTPVNAIVTRVTGPLVSLRLRDGATTVRWPAGVPVAVGREVSVHCYTDPPYLNHLIAVGIEVDGERYWVDEQALARYARPQHVITRPAFVPVLVAAGLIDTLEIDPALYGSSPVAVVMAHHRMGQAIDRGFLHYDHRWANWTKDPIADLASLVRRRDIRMVRASPDELVFELAGIRYTASDLWRAAAHIDAWLAEHSTTERSTTLRLFRWDTRVDAYAFLARPLADGVELAAALGDDGLVPASTTCRYPAPGDDDYL